MMELPAKFLFETATLIGWLSFGLLVQIPQDIPHQSEPVDFTESYNVWFYLGVPLLMIVLYFIIRKMRRNRRQP